MKTDEPDAGAQQDQRESNVVRFPRDWLGPLDELVPFGPSAGQDPDRSRSPERPSPAPSEVRRLSPIRPEDFWGEEAAAIHDALEGDPQLARDASGLNAPAPPADPGAKTRVLRRGLPSRRPARSHGDAESRRLLLSLPRRIGYRVPRRQRGDSGPRRRFAGGRSAAIAVAAVAIATTALMIPALDGSPANRLAQKPSAGAAHAVAGIAFRTTAGAYIRLERHRLPPPRRALQERVRPRALPAPPRVSHATFVRAISQPAPAAPAPPPVQSPAQQALSPQPVIASAPPRPVISESSRAPAATSSGRPPFGQNGLLGPGSSPNS